MKIKHNFLLVGLMVLAFLAGLVLYPSLPDQVPIHWNLKGEIDGYGSKSLTLFGLPLLVLALYLLMTYLPLVDPRKENYAKFAGTYNYFRSLLTIFMLGMYLLTILAALGYSLKMDLLVRTGISFLFVLLGNYLGKVRPNYFTGIKTPWTLADEEVWVKTHRLGAKLFVVGGLIGLASLPLGTFGGYLNLAAIVVLPLATIPYSYLLYRRKHG